MKRMRIRFAWFGNSSGYHLEPLTRAAITTIGLSVITRITRARAKELNRFVRQLSRILNNQNFSFHAPRVLSVRALSIARVDLIDRSKFPGTRSLRFLKFQAREGTRF